jgi:hypothetical protein
MKKMRTTIAALLAVALLAATGSVGTIGASTIESMSLARLAQTAPLIVRAKCAGNVARWDAGEIWTFTALEVEDSWKGAASARLSIRMLGGSVGNITSTVSGVPRFRTGEDVIVFLEPTKLGDFSIESWAQGTFRIHRDARTGRDLVTQDTASVATFDPRMRAFDATGMRGVTVDSFRAQVEAALAAAPSGSAR